MKFAIDAHVLDVGSGAGKARYTSELMLAVGRQVRPGEAIALAGENANIIEPFQHIIVKGSGLIRAQAIANEVKKNNCEVLISPTSYLPVIFSTKPSIMVVHDLAVFLDKHARPALRTRIAEKLLLRRAANKATKIIAVSNQTKSDLLTVMPRLNPDKIVVIGEGVNQNFKIKSSVSNIEQARKKFNLPDKYILFVGTIEPRKNVKGLIDAYKLLPENIRADVPLVIAGKMGWHADSQLSQSQDLITSKQLRLINFVDDEYLPALYAGASVFTYPSFSEGFGLPILEAMSQSTPVITSNRSACAEVAGDGAWLVNPDCPDDIAKAIEGVLMDKNLANTLVEKGKLRLKLYDWDAVAKQVIELMEGKYEQEQKH